MKERYITIFGTRLVSTKEGQRGEKCFIFKSKEDYKKYKNLVEIKNRDFIWLEDTPQITTGRRFKEVIVVSSDYQDIIKELCDNHKTSITFINK